MRTPGKATPKFRQQKNPIIGRGRSSKIKDFKRPLELSGSIIGGRPHRKAPLIRWERIWDFPAVRKR